MNLELLTAYVANKKNDIPGKKAFQKIFYFLTEKGVPTGLSYRIYHYGPYSSDLDYKTDDLVMQGAIHILEPKGSFKTWHIKPGYDAVNIINKYERELDIYRETIDQIIDALPDDSRTLELWSTTHFVFGSKKRLGEKVNDHSIIDAVKEIKGEKFTSDEILSAFQDLNEAKLLS